MLLNTFMTGCMKIVGEKCKNRISAETGTEPAKLAVARAFLAVASVCVPV
jgi:hypothetical protein